MSSTPDPEALHDADFETIEAAVNETARGRWFLAEFARRYRAAETDRLMEALTRIESAVAVPKERLSYDAARFQAAAQDLARRLEDIESHLGAAGLQIGSAPRPLRIEQAAEPVDRRMIEQRMIEPMPFLARAEDSAACLAPAEMHGQIGRLSERLESMRRLGQPMAAEPPSVHGAYPSLADVEAMPLADKLRFFG